MWLDIKEGLAFIAQDRILVKVIGNLTFATTVFMLVAALAPNFVSTVIGLAPGQIGYGFEGNTTVIHIETAGAGFDTPRGDVELMIDAYTAEFVEFARRHGDFAITSAAVLLEGDASGKITRASVTIGGGSSRVSRIGPPADSPCSTASSALNAWFWVEAETF